ncbi:hypothetical protein SPFM15_00067 [Salmonella phage SPFM15]|nr:hypothetical protein SPFM5_00062 [Salmonella phage SPFM5]VFR13691.1 hypothetical protein SPFM15_00067 [Salmonella phage SPFM15]
MSQIPNGAWQYGFGTLWHELTDAMCLDSSATAAFGITEGDYDVIHSGRNHRLLGYWYDTYTTSSTLWFVTQVEDVFIPMYERLAEIRLEEQIFAWIEWFTEKLMLADFYEGYTYEEGITATGLSQQDDCINTERLFTLEHVEINVVDEYTAINVCIEVFTAWLQEMYAFAKNELKDNPQWYPLRDEFTVLLNLTPQFFEALFEKHWPDYLQGRNLKENLFTMLKVEVLSLYRTGSTLLASLKVI